MRDVGFVKDVSHRFEAEFLIEEHGLNLCVESQREGSVSFCLFDGLKDNVSAEAFAAVDCQEPSELPYVGFRRWVKACVCDDASVLAEREMDGIVVNVVLVQISDVLLADKDAETRFEDFVQFGSGKVREGLDLQSDAFRERVGQFGPVSSSGWLAAYFFAEDGVEETAQGFVPDLCRVKIGSGLAVVLHHPLAPFLFLLRVRNDGIDDGIGSAEYRALKFLGFRRRIAAVVIQVIDMFLTIPNAVHFLAFFVHFAATLRAIIIMYYCHT